MHKIIIYVAAGMVEDEISCPLGCGKSMLPFEAKAHCLECEYRIVECPIGCGTCASVRCACACACDRSSDCFIHSIRTRIVFISAGIRLLQTRELEQHTTYECSHAPKQVMSFIWYSEQIVVLPQGSKVDTRYRFILNW